MPLFVYPRNPGRTLRLFLTLAALLAAPAAGATAQSLPSPDSVLAPQALPAASTAAVASLAAAPAVAVDRKSVV